MNREANRKIQRTSAENTALHVLRTLTKNWPFPKSGGGSGGGSTDEPVDTINKTVGLRLRNLKFPNDANIPRVDYNENLKGFFVSIFNKSDEDLKCRFSLSVLSGDRVIKTIHDEELILEKNSIVDTDEYNLQINKKDFSSPGKYRLVLKLIDKDKNEKKDQIVRNFWVETEPELGGPFKMQPTNFSEWPNVDVGMEWFLDSEGDNRYKLYYNVEHPAYQNTEDDIGRQEQYLAELCMQGALKLMIQEAVAEGPDQDKYKKLPFDIEKLISNNPKDIYSEYVRANSIIKADVYNII